MLRHRTRLSSTVYCSSSLPDCSKVISPSTCNQVVSIWPVYLLAYSLAVIIKTVTISNRQDAKDSHLCLQFFGTTLTETETVELLGLTLSKDLSLEARCYQHG